MERRGWGVDPAYAVAMPADLDALLHAAVLGVGGTERAGQVEMARAVERAIESREHLLVQAGTGKFTTPSTLMRGNSPSFNVRDFVRAAKYEIQRALRVALLDQGLSRGKRAAGCMARLQLRRIARQRSSSQS